MNLNKRTAAFKLFAACHIMSKKLFGATTDELINYHGDDVNVPTSTNLCTLMRTILVWTPVYLALFLLAISGLSYVIFYMPALFGGLTGYFNSYVIIGTIVGVIVGIIWGFTTWVNSRDWEGGESYLEKTARHEAGDYTLWETFVKWLGAIHGKSCPLITVVDEPVTKEVVIEPTPPTPAPVASDVPAETPEPTVDSDETVNTEAEIVASSDEIEQAIDDIIEELTPEVPEEKVKASRAIIFLADTFPNFQMFFGAAVAMLVVAAIHLMMANIMGESSVVFETAECVASYDVESSNGRVVCGGYETYISSTYILSFVNDTVLLKKKPYCSVEKETFTDDIDFDCEYK